MRARAVIGANFGDEGKGLITDWLCATQGADVVVRFNGGAQAGHTVVTPGGLRHVFGHFGSGTLAGVPTYLSEFFICNPIMYFKERDELRDLGIPQPAMFAHPKCLVTTFVDMIINQRKEDNRGDNRHGSVGIGIHETMVRSDLPHLKLTMSDLWNRRPIEPLVEELATKYASFRTGSPVGTPAEIENMMEKFIHGCELFAEEIEPLGINACRDPVFEGAQGLLLDMDNREFFPHVTHSKTGAQNFLYLANQLGATDLDAYYVSRTYLTRHGAGFLPGEDPRLSFPDDTNKNHDYQGDLRFAPLDVDGLMRRIESDWGKGFKLVLTHCDQRIPPCAADLYSNGPTRADVYSHEAMLPESHAMT